MSYEEERMFKKSVSLEAVRKDKIYHEATMRFNALVSMIEDKLDEDDKILIYELIYNKIVAEVAAANIMYKQGLGRKTGRRISVHKTKVVTPQNAE